MNCNKKKNLKDHISPLAFPPTEDSYLPPPPTSLPSTAFHRAAGWKGAVHSFEMDFHSAIACVLVLDRIPGVCAGGGVLELPGSWEKALKPEGSRRNYSDNDSKKRL